MLQMKQSFIPVSINPQQTFTIKCERYVDSSLACTWDCCSSNFPRLRILSTTANLSSVTNISCQFLKYYFNKQLLTQRIRLCCDREVLPLKWFMNSTFLRLKLRIFGQVKVRKTRKAFQSKAYHPHNT